MNRSAPQIVPPIFPRQTCTSRILCVWLKQWPLQRLTAARGELEGRPVLIYQAAARRNLTVVDYWPARGPAAAPGCGIEPGMPLAEALALHGWAAARRSRRRGGPDPALHLEAHDPAADRAALIPLAQMCQKFSPLVGLEEAEQPDCLLLEIGPVSQRFGGERQLAEQLAGALTERGLCPRLAVADSLGAAWALAHYQRGEPLKPRQEAGAGERKTAHRGVATLVLAASQQMPQALGPLPIAALRLDPLSLAHLDRLGVERIEQLAILPRAGLAIRFGPGLLRRLDQALAAAAEVITPCRWPAELEASWVFESPTVRREEIEWVLAELLSRLARPLADERRGVLELAGRLELPAGESCRVALRLFRPTVCCRHLVDMFRLRLETLRLEQPIAAIHLAVTASDRLDFEQQTLFDVKPAEAQPRRLAQAIDRLTHRLSREAVLRPLLLADAQPEYACQYLPLSDLGRLRTRQRGSSHADTKTARSKPDPFASDRPAALSTQERPTRLYTPAVALQAVTVAPDGSPAGFDLPALGPRRAAGRQRVARAWGPERIETGWWRSRRVRRDYYRVETAAAERYWLFRCLTTNRWFLQGAFD